MGQKNIISYWCDGCGKDKTQEDLAIISAQIDRTTDAAGSGENVYLVVELCSSCLVNYIGYLHRQLRCIRELNRFADGQYFKSYFGNKARKE